MTTAYRVGIIWAEDLRGRRRGYRGHLPPRKRVEVCQECSTILLRGACPDCIPTSQTHKLGNPTTPEPS